MYQKAAEYQCGQFAPFVVSVDRLLYFIKCIAASLAIKWEKLYSGFVRTRLSFATLRSASHSRVNSFYFYCNDMINFSLLESTNVTSYILSPIKYTCTLQ